MFYFVFMSVGEPHTRLSGIKQDLLHFKNEINSVLVNIKTEMQSKSDDINNRFNMIENNIKSSINDQVNDIKRLHHKFLKDDNKKLFSKTEDLEMKLHETALSLNRLDEYNQRNNIELQGIPSNTVDEALEGKVNVFKLLNTDIKKSDIDVYHKLGISKRKVN